MLFWDIAFLGDWGGDFFAHDCGGGSDGSSVNDKFESV